MRDNLSPPSDYYLLFSLLWCGSLHRPVPPPSLGKPPGLVTAIENTPGRAGPARAGPDRGDVFPAEAENTRAEKHIARTGALDVASARTHPHARARARAHTHTHRLKRRWELACLCACVHACVRRACVCAGVPARYELLCDYIYIPCGPTVNLIVLHCMKFELALYIYIAFT